ncbi:unnamed protein product [Heligmosomoides polygyrus]|uniref:ANF_receptor domain-containing protein n=1 Tax=Heligmosomoides polygyrus TaxID=6339 RepID=A0A183GCV7_HELPZ|nr:unnamed protein product [Heligmosomoides polygyrus]
MSAQSDVSVQKEQCRDQPPQLLLLVKKRAEFTRKLQCEPGKAHFVRIEVAKRKRTRNEDKQEEMNGQKDRANVKPKRVKIQRTPALLSYTYPDATAPIAMAGKFPREVKFNELDDLFKFSYGVLTNLAFPGVDVPPKFASEDDWLAVLRAIFKGRVDFSFSKATGSRPANCVPLVCNFAIPHLLADCINSYGEIVVAQSSTTIYPRPQDIKQGELPPRIDVEATARFSFLVNTLGARGLVKVGYISSDYRGTPAYVLAAFGSNFGRVMPAEPVPPLAFNASVAFVKSWFPEFTKTDAVLCAVMANGHVQNLLNSDHWPWSAPNTISYVPGIRQAMCMSY